MKKPLSIIAALSIAFVTSVNAQKPDAHKIKVGLKIGANLTTLGVFKLDGNEYDYNYKPGFTAGVFSEIPLGGKFKLIPEINYSQKGADVEGEANGIKATLEQRLNYMDVPLSLSYHIVNNLSVFGGPQVSFILNQTTKNTTYFPGVTVVNQNKDTDKIAKAIPGGVIGLYYQLPPNLNLSARYMTDLMKGSKDKDPRFTEVRNSGFSLTIGYNF
ncbi:MAG TPA: porin family protein [Pelobium sp.]|nr:porin family protein [Pelobium sp.]